MVKLSSNSAPATTAPLDSSPLIQRGLRRLRATSIATRTILLVVAFVGITAVLIGSLSYSRARDALEAAAKTRLQLLARDIAEHLQGEFDDRVADITGWARLEVMVALLYQDVDKELAQFLTRTLDGRRIYRAIACFDRSGHLVASAGESNAMVAPLQPPARVSVTLVRHGERPAMGSLRVEAAIANPHRPDDIVGTLVVLLDQGRILETINASVQGGTGPVTLTLTADHEVVLQTDSRQGGAKPAPPPLDDGTIMSVADVGSTVGADAPAFRVMVSQDRRVALARANSLRIVLFRTGLVVLLLSAASGALVAWRIVVPVRALTARVREIAERGHVVSGSAFPEGGGEVGVLASAFRSMVERLEEAQRESLAQSRLALLGEVAANVAHEVRNPLLVLKTSAQLLARAELPIKEQRQLATMVASEVDRLNGVVTKLVDLVRPKPVKFSSAALAPIVERAVGFFAPMARQHRVDLRWEGSDADATIYGNVDQIYQVLLNLVYNALQALDGAGSIVVSLAISGSETVRVEIADDGPGFASEALPHVFTPFFTTKTDGTGLGLAIAKRIVEEHGGEMGANNRAGGGAVVWFKLSLKET